MPAAIRGDMSLIRPLENAALPNFAPNGWIAPGIQVAPADLPPAPYTLGAMFKKLENGRHALTGRTGDAWDVIQAPEWRFESKFWDPFAIQASDVAGSLAFAVNLMNNAAGRIVCDIPALVDRSLQDSLGVNFDELSLISRSATPGNPLDDIPFYLLARASEISRFGKSAPFREKLLVVAERMQHIEANHGWRNLSLPKSLFFPHVDKRELIRLAEGRPKIPQKGRKFAQIAAAKDFVGLDCTTGLPTKVYSVISEASGKVITAHPGLPDPKFAPP